jgi:lipopolysaccharide export system protein LptA
MTFRPLALIAALAASPAAAQLPKLEAIKDKLDVLGDMRIDSSNFNFTPDGNVVISGPVHIRSDEMEVFCEKAEYIAAKEQMRFLDDVAIYKDGLIYRGNRATYNTQTEQLDASELRSSIEPLFFSAGSLTTRTREISVIEVDNAEFTTDDSTDPSFHIESEHVSIYPDDRVVFRKLKIYAGDTPIFYLPYLSQPLNDEVGYTFAPGYRSNLGFFLMNQYGVTWGDHSIAKYKLDLYASRGVGAGIDINSRRYTSQEAFGKFRFYGVYDTDPERNNTFSRVQRDSVDSSRYRVNLQHRIYLPGPEESDIYLDVDVNKISDAYFYEDFFPTEFREDPNPDNLVNLVKRSDQGEFNLLTRFRANDFYQSDTRLPELSLDMPRQPIFNTGLFYNGTSSFGILEEKRGDFDRRQLEDRVQNLSLQLADPALATLLDAAAATNTLAELRGSLIEQGFNRFHTYHEALYPGSFGGGFTLTPRLGVGYTNYSSVSGPSPENLDRTILAAGLEGSFKLSRVYDHIQKPSLGINGLRHVIQPYFNWSFVSADSIGNRLKGIDRLALSTRPRPLDLTNYTAVDALRDWNVVRIGAYNRLQTKRNRGTFNWLQTNTYVDVYADDPEFDRTISNLYQEIEWNPVPWTRLNMAAQIPTGDDASFTEINTRATFMPIDSLDLSLGHRYLQDHPYFQNSNLIDLGAYARVTENWGFSAYQRYEAEDSTLELQQYSVHRDLSSWVASLGAIIRDHRGQDEWGLLFSMTLKDFPSVRIPVDFDPQGGRR